MACWLARNPYLNQCSILVNKILWHSTENNFTVIAQATIPYDKFENDSIKIAVTSPRCQCVTVANMMPNHLDQLASRKQNWFIESWLIFLSCSPLLDRQTLRCFLQMQVMLSAEEISLRWGAYHAECFVIIIKSVEKLSSSQWRHNGRDGVSNHQPHNCLLNRLFRRRSKKTSKLCVTGLCAGNSPVPGEFPAQMASNAENVSISWCHHDWWQPLTPQVALKLLKWLISHFI